MGNLLKKRELTPELTQAQLVLIKHNTGKSEAEIRRWYRDFYKAADGKHLTKSDFIKYYQELLPYRGDCDDFCELVFEAMDKDESDSLDYVEIFIGFTILANGNIDQRLEWMFEMYDQNDDGFIDRNELKTAIRAILIMTDINFNSEKSKVESIVESLMSSMDKDNDSKISLQEFVNTTKGNDILNNLLCPSNISTFFATQ